MIIVTRQVLTSGDDDSSVQAFEVFDELVKSTSTIINGCVGDLLQLLMEVLLLLFLFFFANVSIMYV